MYSEVNEMNKATTAPDLELRERAKLQIQRKREFQAHAMAYVLVNAFFIAIWAVTGSALFWPIFPMVGWGIGVVFHAWDVYRRPPTEARIQREIERLRER
jgi:hypothetical protein